MGNSKFIQTKQSVINLKAYKSTSLKKEIVESIAEETPIALIYNGISHVVMMGTPSNLEDFALGFSITEGIIKKISDVYSIEIEKQDNGIELNIEINSENFVKLKGIRRNLTGRTGCGLCGAESLSQAMRIPKIQTSKSISSSMILSPSNKFVSIPCVLVASAEQEVSPPVI